jgi:hypothetical protein
MQKSNSKIVINDSLLRKWNKAAVVYLKIKRFFLKGLSKTTNKSGLLVSRPTFLHETSRIRSRSTNVSVAKSYSPGQLGHHWDHFYHHHVLIKVTCWPLLTSMTTIFWDIPLCSPLTLNGLHGVISQKIVLFITTAVRTSNPTLLTSFAQQCMESPSWDSWSCGF